MTLIQSKHLARQPLLWLAAVLGAATVLAACGGGGGVIAAVGSGGTGAALLAQGPIVGFGSVIVNGVRYDDSAATVSIDDDATHVENDLRLGMLVQIDADRDPATTTGKARSIDAHSQVKGPISAKDAATLTVLGLTATVTTQTVFDGGVTGLADLAATDIVEIYGIADGRGGLQATRIEKKDPATTDVRIVGTIKNLNAGKTSFTLDNGGPTGPTVNIDLNTRLDKLPNGLVEGVVVRVRGTLANATTINATRIRGVDLKQDIVEGQNVELEGVVTTFVSQANFTVDNLQVNASNATFEGVPAQGSRVEVKGTIVNGVLVATKVELKNPNQAVEQELHGVVSGFSFAGKTFQVRNTTVIWDSNTAFIAPLAQDGSTNLNGQLVQVRGNVTGSTVLATSIKLD